MAQEKHSGKLEHDPKKSKPDPKPRIPKVSAELYQKMYAAYLEYQTPAYVSKKTGVAESTAKKYIEKGNPKFGFKPLRERMVKIQEMTQAQQDYDQVQAWSEFQKAGRAAFMKVIQRIKQMDPAELDANKIPDHLNRLMTLIERTMGGAEHTHEIRGQFANWTIVQIKDYLEHGERPDGT